MGADRELLQRAAKAAGLEFKWREGDPKWGPEHVGPAAFHGGCWQVWNPLTDDGDALRLAVRLRFHIKVFSAWKDESIELPGLVEIWRWGDSDPIITEYVEGSDYEAATRRAIVRAAAAMPEGGQG